ncbi:unnamed protein product [Mycena citricolor]|uniref:Spt20-like SEP domain-containing protein n=1 Tax=Mycena citricolor TaxID=2018698 RepID=A0AAD2HBJ3_9AGAR|nr:unnamed protein product [Mycena citricolor]
MIFNQTRSITCSSAPCTVYDPMANYNRTRHAEDLLERNASSPPSFAVHLHPEHWTLNNASKFLYNNQISSLLDDIRAHRIPVDFLEIFDALKVPFYDGCLIVELLDYRPQQKAKDTPLDKPGKTRVVLHPNGETLFADLCALNRKHGATWSDQQALEVEAKIVQLTAPPLCLSPDPLLTRIVNHTLRVSTPMVPTSLKRKAAALDPEEDEIDKARRTKIMQYMAPRPGRGISQNYKILDVIQRARAMQAAKPPTPSVPPTEPPHPSPVSVDKLRKQNGTPMFMNGSSSLNQTPSPTHVFPVQSAEAKRAPTPLQHQFSVTPAASSPPQSQPPPSHPAPVPTPIPHPQSQTPAQTQPQVKVQAQPQAFPNPAAIQPRPQSVTPNFAGANQFAVPPGTRMTNVNGQTKLPPPSGVMKNAQSQQIFMAAQQLQQQRAAALQAQQQQQQQQQQQPNGRLTPRPAQPMNLGMNMNMNAAAAAAAMANRGANGGLPTLNQQQRIVAARSPIPPETRISRSRTATASS